MKTFVFDIETVPVDLDSLDATFRDYLLKYADEDGGEEHVQHQMALWALTSRIVAIGIKCIETKTGAVYFQGPVEVEHAGRVKYVSGTERDILTHFWRVIREAHRFVTFNGRVFDCPVLHLRSAMLQVKSSVNLMPHRYNASTHVDLLDQLTYYHATRKFDLHSYCTAFGIPSPKANGITGHDISQLINEGKGRLVAGYCMGDVVATETLFLRWRDYMQT